jgi:hypothetical protein
VLDDEEGKRAPATHQSNTPSSSMIQDEDRVRLEDREPARRPGAAGSRSSIEGPQKGAIGGHADGHRPARPSATPLRGSSALAA